ncbi:hypothetical protein D3C76_1564590 [compost metagenome]
MTHLGHLDQCTDDRAYEAFDTARIASGQWCGVAQVDEGQGRQSDAEHPHVVEQLPPRQDRQAVLQGIDRKCRRQGCAELYQPEHQAELGHAEPLSTDVARADEPRAGTERHDEL